MKFHNLNKKPLDKTLSRRTDAKRRGFTLVEMLLVVTILGILAAIVLPKVVGTGDRARKQAAVTQINAFKTALDMFEVDNGHYPRGKNGLNDLVVKPNDANNWHQYMDNIPADPWGNKYIYDFPGRHNPSGFDLMSMGPDGRVGGDDDIVNWQTVK
jgi:general secretion pathway protein G